MQRHGELREGVGGAVGQRGAGDRAQVAGEHRGAPHVDRWQAGGGRNRIDHHAFERALAEFADEQAQQKVLLDRGGTLEQRAQLGAALGGSALAGGRRDALERRIDIAQRQRWLCRVRAAQCRQRGVADSDPALPNLAGEVGDGDLDLVAFCAAQAARDRVALGELAAGVCDPAGSIDDGGKQGGHGGIVGARRRPTNGAAAAR